MLILSRHTDEAIMIGDDTEVTVTKISGNTVKIQIDAPSETLILRAEQPLTDEHRTASKPRKEGGRGFVLSRKEGESISIGADVRIEVVEIRGNKVSLGIDAPQEIPVHRREVCDAIKRENQKTRLPSPPEPTDGIQ